jgi:acyl carrier protein
VVPTCSSKISASELRAFLNSRLPTALVPTEWLFLDDLPHLPNGKVNRSALPVPAIPQIKHEIVYVAPSTPAESKLVEIWQGLLDVVRIGVNDNFFDMGGHSLKLMQLASRIRKVFNIDLPLIRLFDLPTVAELACELARIDQQSEDTELERILREIELLTDEETMHELNARSADT